VVGCREVLPHVTIDGKGGEGNVVQSTTVDNYRVGGVVRGSQVEGSSRWDWSGRTLGPFLIRGLEDKGLVKEGMFAASDVETLVESSEEDEFVSYGRHSSGSSLRRYGTLLVFEDVTGVSCGD